MTRRHTAFRRTPRQSDLGGFDEPAYGFGWNLALNTPVAVRPSPLEDGWQKQVRAAALVVWLVQPLPAYEPSARGSATAERRAFEAAFLRGYGDCLQALCCWSCGAPRVAHIDRHFCSPACRARWSDEHDCAEWAGILLCCNCEGPVGYPDQSFCSVLCEAEWTAARAVR